MEGLPGAVGEADCEDRDTHMLKEQGESASTVILIWVLIIPAEIGPLSTNNDCEPCELVFSLFAGRSLTAGTFSG